MGLICKNLKNHLVRLLENNITHAELTELVHLSRVIIQSYLGYVRTSITHLCLHQGITVTDLAYDCIAEAFAKDEKNKFHQLENFVHSLNNDLRTTPDIEIFLAFKSFLTRISDAQLARLYAQTDPAGAKIHRNIRDCIKQSSLLTLEKDYRGLVLKPKDKADDHLEEFPREELEQELMSRIDHQCTTPEFLELLYDVLVNQSKYRQSMPVVEVVQILRKAYHAGCEETDNYQIFSDEGLTEFDVKNIRLQVGMALKEKILLTYFARGKLDRKEAEALFNAFKNILDDWCCGEESQASLLDYLKQYLLIDEETYEAALRPKMEYLLKIAREEFAARLMKEI
ncbi:MAG: hypothetical protein HY800_05875 [Ignavibacteriales bacterium]|nr:hypothetical protein [Ignavibacteriales bacterium]